MLGGLIDTTDDVASFNNPLAYILVGYSFYGTYEDDSCVASQPLGGT